MLDSIYHMTLTLLKCRSFGLKKSRFCHLFRNIILDVIMLRYQICKPLVVYQLCCMALYHSQSRRHVIKPFLVVWLFTYENGLSPLFDSVRLSVLKRILLPLICDVPPSPLFDRV